MSGSPRPTKYSIIKSGWGNRFMFQRSYGLKMDPDDMEEGELILDEMLKNAIEEWEEEQSAAAAASGRP